MLCMYILYTTYNKRISRDNAFFSGKNETSASTAISYKISMIIYRDVARLSISIAGEIDQRVASQS